MKILKNSIFTFILGIILFGTTSVLAITIFASDITYDNTKSGLKDANNQDVDNVKDAIDILYSKINSNTGSNGACIFTSNKYGSSNNVGAKYACDLGDGVARNFYILSVNENNVKMIMEKNITDEVLVNNSRMLSWNAAQTFFDVGNPGYETLQSWTKIDGIDLPSAQELANVSNIPNWDVTTSTSKWTYFGVNSEGDTSKRSDYAWLYNYTRGCTSSGCENGHPSSNDYPYGYWTKDAVYNSSNAWIVCALGGLDNSHPKTHSSNNGVRPVITIAKSKLIN